MIFSRKVHCVRSTQQDSRPHTLEPPVYWTCLSLSFVCATFLACFVVVPPSTVSAFRCFSCVYDVTCKWNLKLFKRIFPCGVEIEVILKSLWTTYGFWSMKVYVFVIIIFELCLISDWFVQEYEEEGRRSRRHSSPCNSREGSTTALHTQHYDDAVSSFLISIYTLKHLYDVSKQYNVYRHQINGL